MVLLKNDKRSFNLHVYVVFANKRHMFIWPSRCFFLCFIAHSMKTTKNDWQQEVEPLLFSSFFFFYFYEQFHSNRIQFWLLCSIYVSLFLNSIFDVLTILLSCEVSKTLYSTVQLKNQKERKKQHIDAGLFLNEFDGWMDG